MQTQKCVIAAFLAACLPAPSVFGGGDPACGTADHDCCTIGEVGCNDEACCNAVCAQDPFCCDTMWDSFCVQGALNLCGPCPPANDSCKNPIDVFAGSVVTFDTTTATTGGPLLNGCAGNPGGQIANDIWYRINGPSTGNANLVVTVSNHSFPARVAIYDTCFCPLMQPVACGQGFPGTSFSVTAQHQPCGSCYLICVGGVSGASGTGQITISVGGGGSNLCSGAEFVTEGSHSFSTFCMESSDETGLECATALSHDVWFRYSPGELGTVQFDSTPGTILFIYEAMVDNCVCGASLLIACGQDPITVIPSNPQQSCFIIRVGLPPGQPDTVGTLTIQFNPAPANNMCANAQTITQDTTALTTIGATPDGPVNCFMTGDVWFNYTATQTGTLYVDTAGSHFDGLLAVYDTCGCPVGNLLGCDETPPGDYISAVAVPVMNGQCYKIRVGYPFGGTPNTGVVNVSYPITPPNDVCANAIAVAVGNTPFSTFDAFTDGPDHAACAFDNHPGIDKDVWFDYTPTTSGLVQFDTCQSFQNFDTEIAVYEGCSCPASDATLLACNDQACGNQSSVLISVVQGACYKVRVGGYQNSSGNGVLRITHYGPIPPNDNCANAINVTNGTVPFSTTAASTDGPDHSGCNWDNHPGIDKDIWFNYTAPVDGVLVAQLCGSSFDTEVNIYSGSACPVSDTNLLSCNDQHCGDQSRVAALVQQGQVYKIRVGGWNGSSGTGTMMLSVNTCLDCPPGTVAEAETCGQDTNGGCNSMPQVFETITCGQPICGTFWYNLTTVPGFSRDTDWYKFTVAQNNTAYTVSLTAAHLAGLYVVPVSTCNATHGVNVTACSNNLQVTLTAGDYYIAVVPESFGIDCGADNDKYVLELTCTAPSPGDANGDGNVNVDDLLIVINEWGECPPTKECMGDLNNSGLVNVDDLLLVINSWNP